MPSLLAKGRSEEAASSGTEEMEMTRSQLLKKLKAEVKQIMEESVTRKFINEESSTVTSLCGAVEQCLLHKLKRRLLGLFGNSSTFGLLHKLAKLAHPPSANVLKLVLQMQQKQFKDLRLLDSISLPSSLDMGSSLPAKDLPCSMRYLWIRVALFDRSLASIVDFIVQNASRFYDRNALMSDPIGGVMVANLLAGPCALEYSKMKTQDHYWTDPPADELIQRHRIHSRSSALTSPVPPSPISPRPGLQIRRVASLNQDEVSAKMSSSAREYVLSLHQNYRSTLLYGKNGVTVEPEGSGEPLRGYLSLHQNANSTLLIRWTPNALMHANSEPASEAEKQKNLWNYAINLNVENIVYLHCHQAGEAGGTLVFVGADGVQYPPVRFPSGQHPLQFLACLENGLLPWAQLDPPLWYQKGKGKVFPKLRRRSTLGSAKDIGAAVDAGCAEAKESPTTTKSKSPKTKEPTLPPSSPTLLNNDVDDGDGDGVKVDVGDGGDVKVDDSDAVIVPPQPPEAATDYVFRIIPTMKSDKLESGATLPRRGGSGGGRRPGTNSRLVSLSGFSERFFKGRLMSLQSSPVSSPGLTPRASENDVSSIAESITPSLSPIGSPKPSQRSIFYLSGNSSLDAKHAAANGPTSLVSTTQQQQASASACATAYDESSRFAAPDTIDDAPGPSSSGAASAMSGGTSPLTKRHSLPSLCRTDVMLSSSTMDEGPVSPSRKCLQSACDSMRYQILYRAFYGWLAHCRHLRTLRTHLACLVKLTNLSSAASMCARGLDRDTWQSLLNCASAESLTRLHQFVYFGGMSPDLRPEVWPFLLGLYEWGVTPEARSEQVTARHSSETTNGVAEGQIRTYSVCSEVFEESEAALTRGNGSRKSSKASAKGAVHRVDSGTESADTAASSATATAVGAPPGAGAGGGQEGAPGGKRLSSSCEDSGRTTPDDGDGGTFSKELIDTFAINLHRIEKDVHRCDRSYPFFSLPANLDKLKNIMCTYVWEHLEMGYVQGMCDLAAPLLVVFDDEVLAYGCFVRLMDRMAANFPHGGAMDVHLANMRSLIQVLDPELFELMHRNGDYTHFYFCYRWFLLDFKRELVYDDVFLTWEVIWAARAVASESFVLFIALALIQFYREIILDNAMDFTDIIKFFNEMAEKHEVRTVLKMARDLILKLQEVLTEE